jgi:hypothetical protein
LYDPVPMLAWCLCSAERWRSFRSVGLTDIFYENHKVPERTENYQSDHSI